MIKLTLKRKKSGKEIRKAKRKQELYTKMAIKVYNPISDSYEDEEIEVSRHKKDYSYDRNLIRRHIENPNVYEGEKPLIGGGTRQVRLPKKKRKTAWKRFKKNFPYIEVTRSGGKRFNEEKFKKFKYGSVQN